MKLKAAVLQELERHGLAPGAGDAPETLRERLNDLYLGEVRRLRERRRRGDVSPRDYAGHVAALRERFPLLGLPLPLWPE